MSLASPAAWVASSMFFDAIVRDETRTAEAEARFLVKAVRVMVRSMIAVMVVIEFVVVVAVVLNERSRKLN